ncbi:MAG: hypothetical protein GY851_25990 [bacterium]|nr:hypothetical protein [bacterium]
MHDPLKDVERLAALARRETAPGVDVSARVLGRLTEDTEPDDRPLTWLAGAAAVVAAAACIVGYTAIQGIVDPLNALFQLAPPIGA